MTVKIEANRGRYGRQSFAAIGVDDWLASAIACLDRLGHSCDGAGTSPISLLTNSVKI